MSARKDARLVRAGRVRPAGKGIVLVVDDDPAIREAVGLCLPKDIEMVGLADGEGFLEALEAYHPDAVILDIRLPKVDGFQLCRRLRASKEHRHVPVLFLTSLPEDVGFVRGLQAAGDAYLMKPFSVKEFLEALQRIVDLGI